MAHQIVALYEDHEEAQMVRDELIAAGFGEQEVLMRQQPRNAAVDPAVQPRSLKEEVMAFLGLHEKSGTYSPEQYSCRGGTFVAVNCGDDECTHKAARIIEAHFPVDIDDRAEYWHEQGLSGYHPTDYETKHPAV